MQFCECSLDDMKSLYPVHEIGNCREASAIGINASWRSSGLSRMVGFSARSNSLTRCLVARQVALPMDRNLFSEGPEKTFSPSISRTRLFSSMAKSRIMSPMAMPALGAWTVGELKIVIGRFCMGKWQSALTGTKEANSGSFGFDSFILSYERPQLAV